MMTMLAVETMTCMIESAYFEILFLSNVVASCEYCAGRRDVIV